MNAYRPTVLFSERTCLCSRHVVSDAPADRRSTTVDHLFRQAGVVLRLVCFPWDLASQASMVSNLQAVTYGFLAVFFMTSWFFGICAASVAEPYPNVLQFLLEIPVAAASIGTLMSIPFCAMYLIPALGLAYCSSNLNIGGRVLILGPLTLILPFTAWSIFGALAEVAEPTFNLTQSAKPSWISTTPFTGLGSLWTLAGVILCLVVNYNVALRKLSDQSKS